MSNELFVLFGDAMPEGKVEALEIWDYRPSAKTMERAKEQYERIQVENFRVVHLVMNESKTAYVVATEIKL